MEKLLNGTKTKQRSNVQFKKMSTSEKILWIVGSIFVLIGALSMIFPYYWMFVTSIKTFGETNSFEIVFWPKEPQWGIFKSVLTDENNNLFRAMGNTMLVEIPVLIIGTLVSTMCAFAFAKLKFRFKKALFICLMVSTMIPYAAVMLPQYRAWQELKVTTSESSFVRLLPLIIPGLFGNMGMTFFLVTSMKTSIHNSVIESAKVDGCSYFRMWWDLALPLSKNAIAAQLIFWFVGIWNDYFAPSLYLTDDSRTIQVVIMNIISGNKNGVDTAKMMACAFIASIPMIVVFLICRNMFIASNASSGVKE